MLGADGRVQAMGDSPHTRSVAPACDPRKHTVPFFVAKGVYDGSLRSKARATGRLAQKAEREKGRV